MVNLSSSNFDEILPNVCKKCQFLSIIGAVKIGQTKKFSSLPVMVTICWGLKEGIVTFYPATFYPANSGHRLQRFTQQKFFV